MWPYPNHSAPNRRGVAYCESIYPDLDSRRRGQSGFVLIELLIVVTILGILMTLAAAGYYGALVRTHVADGLSLVAPIKLRVADNLSANPTADACIGISDIVGPVDSLLLARCKDDGSVAKIHVQLTREAADVAVDFVSRRDGSVVWQCVSDPAAPGYHYLPAGCK
jgi:prepilin-type N-terminal cleavage/methylation domain-containing protein